MQIVIDISDNDKQKETILKSLAQENEMVLSQAYLYAKYLVNYGLNIAEKWVTVTQQAAALDKAYRYGRYDEAERMSKKEKTK